MPAHAGIHGADPYGFRHAPERREWDGSEVILNGFSVDSVANELSMRLWQQGWDDSLLLAQR